MDAGYQTVTWDLRNDVGGLTGPGIYLCRIQAGKQKAQQKMIVLP
jgi:hypothetical protein